MIVLKRLVYIISVMIVAIALYAQMSEKGKKMRISVEVNRKITVFQLNQSRAAQELYAQLPLEIDVEDYGDNEKIFYPPSRLDTSNTPLADAKNGTLAYYAPWGDVVMFYADFGSADGLYELGQAVDGIGDIKEISGTIVIERVVTGEIR